MLVRSSLIVILACSLLACSSSGGSQDTASPNDLRSLVDTAPGGGDRPSARLDETGGSGELLRGGAARVIITPEFEPYTDLNDSRTWDEGEPFEDLNGNGKLDSLWMGGFGLRQPTGVHTDLWARAVALEVHGELFVLVAVDALGLSLKRIETIKDLVTEGQTSKLHRDRVIVASSHTHAAPDNVGVFGPSGEPGWDGDYLEHVVQSAAAVILEAIDDLQPVELLVTSAEAGAGYVRDSDPPYIIDPYVGVLSLRTPQGEGVATMVTIANHPEAFWGENTLISSDFPHYLREKLEQNLGGTALYFSGPIGLMQTPDEMGKQGEERAQLLGEAYAVLVLAALAQANPVPAEDLAPRFSFAKFMAPLDNIELFVGLSMEIADGYVDYLYETEEFPCDFFGCLDVPCAALKLGEVTTIVTFPGEFTPELVVGGIVSPDFYEGPFADVEAEPVLVDHLTTPHRFVIGLAGAEIGYVYPKMTFDPPNHFSQIHGPGPKVAGYFMGGLADLLDQLNSED